MIIVLICVSAFILWCAGFLILFRLPVCTTRPGGTQSGRGVSVIVPARNESKNLPRLLDSLASQQGGPREIIVVDDHSEDNTAELARAAGARVVSAPELPAGWLGKPWACHQGALAAAGDVLVFVDADTYFEDGGYQKLIDTYDVHPGVVSVCPYHRVRRAYETGSAFFNLMQIAGTRAFSYRAACQPAGMFGQCLVISKSDYIAVGGYESVRDQVLENFMLARLLTVRGVPVHLYVGRGTISMRLYPNGMRELIRGWSKSFIAGAQHTPRDIMRLSGMWFCGLIIAAILPFAALGSTGAALLWAGLIYALYAAQVVFLLARIGSFPLWSGILYPLPLGFFLSVFVWAGSRARSGRSVTWKGRTISAR